MKNRCNATTLIACLIRLTALLCAGASFTVSNVVAAADAYPTHAIRSGWCLIRLAARRIFSRASWRSGFRTAGSAGRRRQRPGAGNNMGTERWSCATPDGYTVLLVNPANAINATLYTNLTF